MDLQWRFCVDNGANVHWVFFDWVCEVGLHWVRCWIIFVRTEGDRKGSEWSVGDWDCDCGYFFEMCWILDLSMVDV